MWLREVTTTSTLSCMKLLTPTIFPPRLPTISCSSSFLSYDCIKVIFLPLIIYQQHSKSILSFTTYLIPAMSIQWDLFSRIFLLQAATYFRMLQLTGLGAFPHAVLSAKQRGRSMILRGLMGKQASCLLGKPSMNQKQVSQSRHLKYKYRAPSNYLLTCSAFSSNLFELETIRILLSMFLESSSLSCQRVSIFSAYFYEADRNLMALYLGVNAYFQNLGLEWASCLLSLLSLLARESVLLLLLLRETLFTESSLLFTLRSLFFTFSSISLSVLFKYFSISEFNLPFFNRSFSSGSVQDTTCAEFSHFCSLIQSTLFIYCFSYLFPLSDLFLLVYYTSLLAGSFIVARGAFLGFLSMLSALFGFFLGTGGSSNS